MDGSNQGSWPETTPGTMVNITCLETHKLNGNSKLLCGANGTWSSSRPICEEIGELGRKYIRWPGQSLVQALDLGNYHAFPTHDGNVVCHFLPESRG